MLKKIALLLLLIAPMSVFAQKFGHVKFAEILTVMPEYTNKNRLTCLRISRKDARKNCRN